MLLEKCWSRDPTKRPSAVQVYDALSQFRPSKEVLPHADNHCAIPMLGAYSEEPNLEAAQRCIDEIAEVTQLVTSSSGPDHVFVLGTRAWESKARGG